MQKKPLASKVALVTGAARRIGAEIARTLHAADMNIVLHYNTSEAEALDLCKELNEIRSHSAVVAQADLTKSETLKGLVQQAMEPWKRLDALVNNASRFYSTPLGKATDFAWNDLMDSNLRSPFFLSQAAAPSLAAVQGSIVNITDIHAERPLVDYSVYCISKSGLVMMTKAMAKEYGPLIRVNAVAPGAIIWPEGKSTLSEEEKQRIIGQTCLQRPGSPEDIAKAVLFFVRDAEYVTGQILDVDGGRILSS